MHWSLRSSIASLLPVALLAPRAFGQQSSNVSSTTTRSVVQPNATAVVPIPGYALDLPYPGLPLAASGNSWSMHLDITETTDPPERGAGQWIQFDFALRSPKNNNPATMYNSTGDIIIDRRVADTWTIFIIFLGFQDEVGTDGNQRHGSCQSILSDQCMNDLTNSTLHSKAVLDGELDQRKIQRLPIEEASPSCPWSWWRTIRSFPIDDRRELFQWNSTFAHSFQKQSAEYENAYDFYGRRTLPFAILFGHSNTTAQGEAPDKEHLVFACIKATDPVGENRLPSSAGQRLASYLSVCSILLAYLVVVMMLP